MSKRYADTTEVIMDDVDMFLSDGVTSVVSDQKGMEKQTSSFTANLFAPTTKITKLFGEWHSTLYSMSVQLIMSIFS